MKVFLSWSGPLSHKVACVFREWLPSVIQSVAPYVSSEDIDKGARWSTDIAKELEDSRYGIICVTRENISAPWINFEAGALSKIIEKSFVTPFLFDIKRSDVQGPLLQFQSTVFDKDDILKLLKSVNNRIPEGERLKEDKLNKAFEVWWPQLNDNFNLIKSAEEEPIKSQQKNKEKTPEILEELLELARAQQRLLNNPPSLIPPEYFAFVLEQSGIRESRRPFEREILERIHRNLIELEAFIQKYSKDHPEIIEAMALLERVHRYFHELPGWPSHRASRRPRHIKDSLKDSPA